MEVKSILDKIITFTRTLEDICGKNVPSRLTRRATTFTSQGRRVVGRARNVIGITMERDRKPGSVEYVSPEVGKRSSRRI